MANTLTHYKDPDAKKDYRMSWVDWLVDDDTITASTWTVTLAPDDTFEIDSDDFDDTSATVWVLGGTAGKTYKATNHIVTAAGREDDRTFTFPIRSA